MPTTRTLVTCIIVLVSVVVLASLAYPSVQVPIFSTATFSNVSTNTYSVTISTQFMAPYATSTLTSVSYYNQPGNFPGCDPASMACNYGFVTPYYSYYTYTYSALTTSYLQVTAMSQWTVTNEFTQTSYQNMPMYTSAGLSDSEFVILAVLTMLAVIAGLFMATKPFSKGPQAKQSVTLKLTCVKCGAELAANQRYCGECGAEAQSPSA